MIKNRIDIMYYKCTNAIKIIYGFMLTSKQLRRKKLLNRNKQFLNKHMGKRCFIVANGPSIANENLSLLKGEHVFTVNQMVRKQEFVELTPEYNAWADPAYFDENMPEESIREFENLFKRTCNSNERIFNFVPVNYYDFMKRHNLIMERVCFIDGSLHFYDGYNGTIDYTKRAPGYQNIVQFAISLCIFMGFKEIYLLGCDSTGIITKINSVLRQDIDNCYTYELKKNDQKYVNSLLDYFSVEEQFQGWARTFHLYKELYRYCSQRNIKLVNCSSNTIIQDIPRMKLSDVIQKA